VTPRICPSILNADRATLLEEIDRVATADLLHLDVMDNIFVPNKTFSLNECAGIIKRSSIPVDSHLMIVDPDEQAILYARMGSASVTFHLEASTDPSQTIKEIKQSGARAGLAIKPNTKYESVEKFLPEIDMLLIMTVEPGFGGQSFMADQLPKIESARRTLSEMGAEAPWLQVDGGISLETIGLAARAGADTFVAGSAIYRTSDPAEAIRALREAAKL
jgi:ribulose-phosphate 3-epimerase